MLRIICLAFALVALAPAWAAPADDGKAAASAIAAGSPGIRWDKTTLVTGDFNGDGTQDWAMVGYKGSGIELAVRFSGGKTSKAQTQLLAFGIDPSAQAAICEAPAKLRVEKLQCQPGDGALSVCDSADTSSSLDLSGGECDSIHIYWNGDAKKMAWRRR